MCSSITKAGVFPHPVKVTHYQTGRDLSLLPLLSKLVLLTEEAGAGSGGQGEKSLCRSERPHGFKPLDLSMDKIEKFVLRYVVRDTRCHYFKPLLLSTGFPPCSLPPARKPLADDAIFRFAAAEYRSSFPDAGYGLYQYDVQLPVATPVHIHPTHLYPIAGILFSLPC